MNRIVTILLILMIISAGSVFAHHEESEVIIQEYELNSHYAEEIIDEQAGRPSVPAAGTAGQTDVFDEQGARPSVPAAAPAGNVIDEQSAVRPQAVEAEQKTEAAEIPQGIRNNKFFLESQRLTKLAQDTYEYGDYEASSGFADEAVRNALLSDQFVADQLIAEAKRLVDWADFYKIAERNPHNVQLGKDHYEAAVAFQTNEAWNEASDSAMKSIEVLSVLQAGTGTPAARPPATTTTTPSDTATGRNQYTVRTWAVERDCFWTIAGYDWVYGDPWQWRKLYEANKDKIPEPDNPDLLEPGTVLNIPR